MVSGTQRKYYMLGGKGGVGKTSCAVSLAVKFANDGHPPLVVSFGSLMQGTSRGLPPLFSAHTHQPGWASFCCFSNKVADATSQPLYIRRPFSQSSAIPAISILFSTGRSNAINIAERLGLPIEILSNSWQTI